MKRFAAWLLAACLACGITGAAMADNSYVGTITAGETVPVQVSYGGRLSGITKSAGQLVSEGESLAEVEATLNFAPVEGTISGMYLQAGDKTEDVTERYGASLYIEPTNRYIIKATSDKAYNSSENKYIHLGERVYLKCVTDGSHKGTGMVAALTEDGYQIEVTGGDFYIGEKVDAYRKSDYARESCVGRGTVDRAKPVAVKGSGSAVRVHVANGDFVERGELLFETVEGVLDGLYAPGKQVLSPVSGIISSVEKNNGDSIAKGDTLMKILPTSSLQVEFDIPESDLFILEEGQKVRMELYWETESGKTYEGEILRISHINSTVKEGTTERKTYKAYASITPDARIRAGMTVILYVEGVNGTEHMAHGDCTTGVRKDEKTDLHCAGTAVPDRGGPGLPGRQSPDTV